MKRLLLPLVLLASLIISCNNSTPKRDPAMALQLFHKSVGVIQGYTDSIVMAKDSATLRRVAEAFNEKIAKVNYEFPADTDLDLSIIQNDSLINLLDRLVEEVKKKEREFNVVLQNDSIAADSILAGNGGKIKMTSTSQTLPLSDSQHNKLKNDSIVNSSNSTPL